MSCVIGYIDCQAGIAGDMFLAAALDGGLSLEALQTEIDQLGLAEVKVVATPVLSHGLRATQVEVVAPTGQPARHLSQIEAIISKSGLSQRVKERSIGAFQRLAAVEGVIHGCDPGEVHFHEVGAVDAIVDIVGAFIATELLGVDRWYASPVPAGSGTVQCAHGIIPVPAPATLALLSGWPIAPGGPEGETVTPTGALVLRSLAGEWSPAPIYRPRSTGYGAGHRQLADRPNTLRLIVADEEFPAECRLGDAQHETVAVVEVNLDDMNPEWYSSLVPALLAQGALDVTLTPAIMKKGRPATVVSVLCSPGQLESVSRTLLRETTSLGVRYRLERRLCLTRTTRTVQVDGCEVRIKAGYLAGERVNLAPEYEDCRTAAERLALPVKDVYARAIAVALRG